MQMQILYNKLSLMQCYNVIVDLGLYKGIRIDLASDICLKGLRLHCFIARRRPV